MAVISFIIIPASISNGWIQRHVQMFWLLLILVRKREINCIIY